MPRSLRQKKEAEKNQVKPKGKGKGKVNKPKRAKAVHKHNVKNQINSTPKGAEAPEVDINEESDVSEVEATENKGKKSKAVQPYPAFGSLFLGWPLASVIVFPMPLLKTHTCFITVVDDSKWRRLDWSAQTQLDKCKGQANSMRVTRRHHEFVSLDIINIILLILY
jgi:hypothetical protein